MMATMMRARVVELRCFTYGVDAFLPRKAHDADQGADDVNNNDDDTDECDSNDDDARVVASIKVG